MKNDAGHHTHTPDSWARSLGSSALDQVTKGKSLEVGGPPVSAEVQITVQATAECHVVCYIIGGTKVCFCLP